MEPRLFIVLGILTCSCIIVTYYDYAIKMGLVVDNFFQPENWKGFKLFSIIVGVYFIFAVGIDFGWIYSPIILVTSFILAFTFIRILRSSVQKLSIFGFILFLIINIVVQIEFIPH